MSTERAAVFNDKIITKDNLVHMIYHNLCTLNEVNISKQNIDLIVSSCFDTISESLVQCKDVKINGLGTFRIKHRKPYKICNYKNGTMINSPETTFVEFLPVSKLNRINSIV